MRLAGQPAINFDTTPLYKESLETRARTLQLLVYSGADPAAAARECGFDFTVTAPDQGGSGWNICNLICPSSSVHRRVRTLTVGHWRGGSSPTTLKSK